MIHIFPLNDEKPHDTSEGSQCHCDPEIRWVDPDSGLVYDEPIAIHHAFDCREVVEEAERILNSAELK